MESQCNGVKADFGCGVIESLLTEHNKKVDKIMEKSYGHKWLDRYFIMIYE